MEGLCEVVVRPKVQTTHPVAHVSTSRKQDDGRGVTASAQLRQDRKTVLAGQHDVEHHGVHRRGGQAREHRLPIQSRLGLPSREAKRPRERLPGWSRASSTSKSLLALL